MRVTDGSVVATVLPALLQKTTVGELDGRTTPRIRALAAALKKAGFPTAITRSSGDIDVIAANATYPEQAIAVEVKRVKMPSDSYSTSLPNKLQDLEKRCQQGRLLREIGFHRSYLLVAVVADGREQTEVSFAFRSPTPALVKAVKEKLRSLKFILTWASLSLR